MISILVGFCSVILTNIQVVFFSSSRRRHTRLQGAWSSDVCSSDLWFCVASTRASVASFCKLGGFDVRMPDVPCFDGLIAHRHHSTCSSLPFTELLRARAHERSEERRVGNECVALMSAVRSEEL